MGLIFIYLMQFTQQRWAWKQSSHTLTIIQIGNLKMVRHIVFHKTSLGVLSRITRFGG